MRTNTPLSPAASDYGRLLVKIGILTGGGDVPGLNPAIKAVVNRAVDAGHEVLGIRRGWAGLLCYNPDNPADVAQWLEPLDTESVRTIDRFGGTHLHTSRTNPSKVRPRDLPPFLHGRFDPAKNDVVYCTPHVLRVIERLGLDLLPPIGGGDKARHT